MTNNGFALRPINLLGGWSLTPILFIVFGQRAGNGQSVNIAPAFYGDEELDAGNSRRRTSAGSNPAISNS